MARVLVATYFYPPDLSVGAQRWPPLAKMLRRLGHEVTILTTSAFGALPEDDHWIVRTRDLQAPGLARRLLRRSEMPRTAGGAAAPGSAAPRLLTDGLVPDAHVLSWLPFALPMVRRLVRDRRVECLVTDGPPDSTHLLGPALAGARPAWLVDLEDGWRFEPQRFGWPTRAQDRLDAWLERQVFTRADGVVSISRPIAEDAEARFGVTARAIASGWDPDDDHLFTATPPMLEPGTVSVVHTGALSHAQRRDPRSFFEGLRRFVARRPQEAARVRLVLAGGLTAADEQVIARLEPEIAALVCHLGPLPRPRALALQRAADALLLVATGPHRSTVTGKLFEYLAAGRPVIALSEENEAARIVRETGAGVVVSPDDPEAMADVLEQLTLGALTVSPRDLDAYRLPATAEAMTEAIERAIGRRGLKRRA